MEVLEAIKMFSDKGLKSTGGLSNNSNGAPKDVRPIMDSTLVAMCMMQGLTSAIVNPNDKRLMETIKSCDIFKNHVLYSDSYLDLEAIIPPAVNSREGRLPPGYFAVIYSADRLYISFADYKALQRRLQKT